MAEKSVLMMTPIDANVFPIYAHYTHFFPEVDNVHWPFLVNKHRQQENKTKKTKKTNCCAADSFVPIKQNKKNPHGIK